MSSQEVLARPSQSDTSTLTSTYCGKRPEDPVLGGASRACRGTRPSSPMRRFAPRTDSPQLWDSSGYGAHQRVPVFLDLLVIDMLRLLAASDVLHLGPHQAELGIELGQLMAAHDCADQADLLADLPSSMPGSRCSVRSFMIRIGTTSVSSSRSTKQSS